jgi:hypothetical protein
MSEKWLGFKTFWELDPVTGRVKIIAELLQDSFPRSVSVSLIALVIKNLTKETRQLCNSDNCPLRGMRGENECQGFKGSKFPLVAKGISVYTQTIDEIESHMERANCQPRNRSVYKVGTNPTDLDILNAMRTDYLRRLSPK